MSAFSEYLRSLDHIQAARTGADTPATRALIAPGGDPMPILPRPTKISLTAVENHTPTWVHVWVCDYCAALVLDAGREQHERAHAVALGRQPQPEES